MAFFTRKTRKTCKKLQVVTCNDAFLHVISCNFLTDSLADCYSGIFYMFTTQPVKACANTPHSWHYAKGHVFDMSLHVILREGLFNKQDIYFNLLDIYYKEDILYSKKISILLY